MCFTITLISDLANMGQGSTIWTFASPGSEHYVRLTVCSTGQDRYVRSYIMTFERMKYPRLGSRCFGTDPPDERAHSKVQKRQQILHYSYKWLYWSIILELLTVPVPTSGFPGRIVAAGRSAQGTEISPSTANFTGAMSLPPGSFEKQKSRPPPNCRIPRRNVAAARCAQGT